MPLKRRLEKTRDHRLTPEAVEAFMAGDWLALHQALGLRPWQASPLDVDPDDRPEWLCEEDWTRATSCGRN